MSPTDLIVTSQKAAMKRLTKLLHAPAVIRREPFHSALLRGRVRIRERSVAFSCGSVSGRETRSEEEGGFLVKTSPVYCIGKSLEHAPRTTFLHRREGPSTNPRRER